MQRRELIEIYGGRPDLGRSGRLQNLLNSATVVDNAAATDERIDIDM